MTETETTWSAAFSWGDGLRIGALSFGIPSDFGLGISDFPHFLRNAG
jgi:hypothetical protein